MVKPITDQNVLVFGATRGIGRAIAQSFSEHGSDVAIAARSKDDLEDLTAETDNIKLPIRCDIRDATSVKNAVSTVVNEFGTLDTVINSVGVIARGPISELSENDMEYVIDTNISGAIRVAKEVIPVLVESQGNLINVSSEAGCRGIAGLAVYCASKGGLDTLTKALAVEYAADNVRVNCIAPGTTKTSMNEEKRRKNPEYEEQRSENIPLGRLASAEDMTGAARFLASDDAQHITGAIVPVDGGSTAVLPLD